MWWFYPIAYQSVVEDKLAENTAPLSAECWHLINAGTRAIGKSGVQIIITTLLAFCGLTFRP